MGDVVVDFPPLFQHPVICKFFNAPTSRSVRVCQKRDRSTSTCSWSSQNVQISSPGKWLCVENIPLAATQDDLQQSFSAFGCVISDVVKDRSSQYILVPDQYVASEIIAASRQQKVYLALFDLAFNRFQIVLHGTPLKVEESAPGFDTFISGFMCDAQTQTQKQQTSDSSSCSLDDAQTQTFISASNLNRHVRLSSESEDNDVISRRTPKRPASAPRARFTSPVNSAKVCNYFPSSLLLMSLVSLLAHITNACSSCVAYSTANHIARSPFDSICSIEQQS